MVAKAAQQENVKSAKIGVLSNIQSWEDRYIEMTGLNNIGGDALDQQKLTKQGSKRYNAA